MVLAARRPADGDLAAGERVTKALSNALRIIFGRFGLESDAEAGTWQVRAHDRALNHGIRVTSVVPGETWISDADRLSRGSWCTWLASPPFPGACELKEHPVIDIDPNGTGLPGIEQLRIIVGAVMTVGLILSVLALIVSAIVWGFGANSSTRTSRREGRSASSCPAGRRSSAVRGDAHQLLLGRRPSRLAPSLTREGGCGECV
jgi:hypothetical protein